MLEVELTFGVACTATGIGNEAVTGAVSEAFARCLHHRHVALGCSRRGHIVNRLAARYFVYCGTM